MPAAKGPGDCSATCSSRFAKAATRLMLMSAFIACQQGQQKNFRATFQQVQADIRKLTFELADWHRLDSGHADEDRQVSQQGPDC